MAYICVLKPNAKNAERGVQIAHVAETFRPLISGVLMVNTGLDRVKGDAAVASGQADVVAFGVPFIANPDLVERLRTNAPFSRPDLLKFYGEGPEGYTDYPPMITSQAA